MRVLGLCAKTTRIEREARLSGPAGAPGLRALRRRQGAKDAGIFVAASPADPCSFLFQSKLHNEHALHAHTPPHPTLHQQHSRAFFLRARLKHQKSDTNALRRMQQTMMR